MKIYKNKIKSETKLTEKTTRAREREGKSKKKKDEWMNGGIYQIKYLEQKNEKKNMRQF